VSIEAAVSFGWHDIIGDAGRSISLEHFGASADYKTLFAEFGITADATVKAAKDSLKAARSSGEGAPGVTETAPRKDTDRSRTDTGAKKSAATKSAASASSTR